MPDVRSEIREAFARRLDRASMSADLPARVAEKVTRPPRRLRAHLATAVAVLLGAVVVATFVYIAHGRPQGSLPAATPPAVQPSAAPTETPAPSPSPSPTPQVSPSSTAGPRVTAYQLPNPNLAIAHVAWGPDGAFWFTEDNKVGRLDVSGRAEEFALPSGVVHVEGIAVGPDRAFWLAGGGPSQTGVILRLTTDGHFTTFRLASASSSANGITAGPDGALWFTEEAGNRIGRISTSGAVSEYALPALPGQGAQCGQRCPLDIATGSDGALWFTESQFAAGGGNKIGRITTTGTVTEYPVSTTNGPPIRIVLGPDGNLWFSESRGGSVGRLTPGGQADVPVPHLAQMTEFPLPGGSSTGITEGLAAGSDGAVWVVGTPSRPAGLDTPLDHLYRLGRNGAISEQRLPGGAVAVTEGPPGTMWAFGQGQAWKIEP